MRRIARFVLAVSSLAFLSLGIGSTLAADAKPWAEILNPQTPKLPAPRSGLEVSIDVLTHRKEVAKTSIKWESDLNAALAIAKKENRPVFLTLRCLPCKSCSEFDKTVLEGGPDLNPLFQQFVTVRLISTKDIDLRQLPLPQFQDMDVSWWSWFLSPEGKVYGVFGGRDATGDQARTSKAALVKTMNRVLAHHYDARRPAWDVDGPTPKLEGKPTTPTDLPGFANWLKVRRNAEQFQLQNCLHCHQTSEILRQGEMDAGRFDKKRDLYIWPYPENVGIEVDRDDGLKVVKVSPNSPAAAAGIKAGDVIGAAGGRAVFSQADFRAALHRTPITGAVKLDIQYRPADGKEVRAATLDLPDGWRKTDFDWRASVTDGNIGAFPGFWGIAPPPQVKTKLEVPDGKLAIKPLIGNQKPQSPAAAAGLKADDVIIAINGQSPAVVNRAFIAWFRMNFEPGDDISLTVKNPAGETREVKFKAGK